jgi:hypothetical protein
MFCHLAGYDEINLKIKEEPCRAKYWQEQRECATVRQCIPRVGYQSVCPFLRIGYPRSLSLGTKGGGHYSLVGEGARGANSDDWRESLALCLYMCSGTLTLCTFLHSRSQG